MQLNLYDLDWNLAYCKFYLIQILILYCNVSCCKYINCKIPFKYDTFRQHPHEFALAKGSRIHWQYVKSDSMCSLKLFCFVSQECEILFTINYFILSNLLQYCLNKVNCSNLNLYKQITTIALPWIFLILITSLSLVLFNKKSKAYSIMYVSLYPLLN